MSVFVEVAVNLPGLAGTFDYHVPEALVGKVVAGSLVVVPFGAQRMQGVVLRTIEQPSVPETRPVEDLIDPLPVLTEVQIDFARELAWQTLSPLAACVDLMLPPGLGKHADHLYHLSENVDWNSFPEGTLQQRIALILKEKGALRSRQIEAAMPRRKVKEALQIMVKRGILTSQPVLPEPGVRPKFVRTARLVAPPEIIESDSLDLGRTGSPAFERRKAMLKFLAQETLPVEASWVYAASKGNLADLRKLEELGLVQLSESEIWRDPLADYSVQEPAAPVLTNDQTSVWQRILQGLQQGNTTKPYLLHGVTGSGKTEIYLRAVEETIRKGKQAIVLVPEIALTPQTVRRFLARFPGRVGLVHSQLSIGERFDTWRRARAGVLQVIVGPRSALFTPLPNLGLIVVDECHDSSYYQSEPAPAYHSVDAAIFYGLRSGAVVLLGSATPEVDLLYRAQKEKWHILELPLRILAHRATAEAYLGKLSQTNETLIIDEAAAVLPLPPVTIVDMRQELKAGNRSIFSRALTDALDATLSAGQQAILYLNRLGSATYVFCRDCGNPLRCPRCDRTLTYHSGAAELVCHTCAYHRKMPGRCPVCDSQHIRQFGTGTERVEAELLKIFPQARTLRWDSQSMRNKGSSDILLSHFTQQRADVLIGTQMLAKSLDLPLVTLVGVILADTGLHLEDYRAAERTFQLLTQVAGRAGRSPLGGNVVLQTFSPDHYAIKTAAGHDYQGFYQRELDERRKIGYPPYNRLVRMEVRDLNPQKAEMTARKMAAQVQNWLDAGGMRATRIIGPAPCFFARLNSEYRWQIILCGPDPTKVLRERDLSSWRVEVDPASLL